MLTNKFSKIEVCLNKPLEPKNPDASGRNQLLVLIKDGKAFLDPVLVENPYAGTQMQRGFHPESTSLEEIGTVVNPLPEKIGTAWLIPKLNTSLFGYVFYLNDEVDTVPQAGEASKEELHASFSGKLKTGADRSSVKEGDLFEVAIIKAATSPSSFLIQEGMGTNLKSVPTAKQRFFEVTDVTLSVGTAVIVSSIVERDANGHPSKIKVNVVDSAATTKKAKTAEQMTALAKKMTLRGVNSEDNCFAHLELISNMCGTMSLQNFEAIANGISPQFIDSYYGELSSPYIDEEKNVLKRSLLKIVRGENMDYVGEKGTGKSRLTRTLAYLLNRKYEAIECHQDTTIVDLLGAVELVEGAPGSGSITKMTPSTMLKTCARGHALVSLEEWNSTPSQVLTCLHGLLEGSSRRAFINGLGEFQLPKTVSFLGTRNDNSLGDYDGVNATPNPAFVSRFSCMRLKHMAGVQNELLAAGLTLAPDSIKVITKFWELLKSKVNPEHINENAMPQKFLCSRALIRACNEHVFDGTDIKSALISEFVGYAELADSIEQVEVDLQILLELGG